MIGGAVLVALILGGTTVAVAAGSEGPDHPRPTNREVSALVTAESTGGGCRMGFDTRSDTLVPPDDSTANNVAAASVTITKPCAGAVVGQFTSETITALREAYRMLYKEGRTQSNALDRIEADLGSIPEVMEFATFIRESKVGINPARTGNHQRRAN